MAFYIVKSNVNGLPIDGRSKVTKRDVNEISLKLLPPALPHDHHHHHHHTVPATTKAPATSSTTPKKPKVDIVRYEYENLPDGGYRFL